MAPDSKIRVIIVDDIAETRENIRKLLQFENDVEVIGAARTGREGIDLTKELRPDVVIMDINMPDMDGIAATEAIKRSVPYAQVVILSVQSDPNYLRRAMMAGARNFIAKPPTVDELTLAIRQAGKLALDEKAKGTQVGVVQSSSGGMGVAGMSGGLNGKVICVYSPKGGTGCTVIATNLAIALQDDETPVVLVDGNLQFGDVAISINEQGKFSVIDLAPRAKELEIDLIESVLVRHTGSGVKVLTAPTKPEFAESVTGEQFGDIIKALKRMFSYVVIDTASALGDVTLAAMDAADIIVLITTQDIPSIKNSRLYLDLADALGIDRNRVLFVVNRYDKRIGIEPEKIQDNIKHPVVATLPFDERTVMPSIIRGIPFITGDKSRPIARAVLQLAETVRQHVIEQEMPASPALDLRSRLRK
jgi:pilus assembly protein CpaE